MAERRLKIALNYLFEHPKWSRNNKICLFGVLPIPLHQRTQRALKPEEPAWSIFSLTFAAVNCAVGSWSSWSTCSATCDAGTCDAGTSVRTRPIIRHATHGGRGCPVTREARPCSMFWPCAGGSGACDSVAPPTTPNRPTWTPPPHTRPSRPPRPPIAPP